MHEAAVVYLQFLQEANYFRDNRMSCDMRENVYFREN